MDDDSKDMKDQEVIDLMRRLDEDGQAAMTKLALLLASLPPGEPSPSQEQLTEFVEQARLEHIRIRLGGTVGKVLAFPTARTLSVNESWVRNAYPLQQITIKLQGRRHSSRNEIINQLETVLARLKAGDHAGASHEDDFGYEFDVQSASPGPSFFDSPAGEN